MTREEARSDLACILNHEGEYMDYLTAIEVEAIKALAEERHGEWIDIYYGVSYASATCSACNKSNDADVKDSGFGFEYSFPPFCPNCGAKMEVPDDGT